MTKRTSAKYKLDRRMGENVFGRPKSPVNRREYGPGGSYAEIGGELFLSPDTVRAHAQRAMTKLGARTHAHAGGRGRLA